MKPEYRKELLGLMAKTEQLICGAEALTVTVPDDEVLLVTSKQLAELRQVLADVSSRKQALIGGWSLSVRDAKESLAILQEFAYEPPLEYRVDSEMAATWKTRKKDRVADRDEQQTAIDEIGPLGYTKLGRVNF